MSIFFHSFGDVTITGEGLQILTYARHSWGLACHTYCDTGHSLIMVISISEDPHTHACCRTFGGGAVTTCLNDLGPAWGSNCNLPQASRTTTPPQHLCLAIVHAIGLYIRTFVEGYHIPVYGKRVSPIFSQNFWDNWRTILLHTWKMFNQSVSTIKLGNDDIV